MLLARAPGDRRLGFTLVELIATLAVISVMAVFAVPRFVGTTSYESRGTYDRADNCTHDRSGTRSNDRPNQNSMAARPASLRGSSLTGHEIVIAKREPNRFVHRGVADWVFSGYHERGAAQYVN